MAAPSPDFYFRRLIPADTPQLVRYLDGLGPETRSRFGPHAFDPDTVSALLADPSFRAYGAWLRDRHLVGYALVRFGVLPHDAQRLSTWGLHLNESSDATFAPSVADAWQGKGVGGKLFQFLLADLKATPVRRLILWGGVQESNTAAVALYRKSGFEQIGRFEHNGWNLDMIKTWD
jgi:ribosomal protein S18 acetylase RimI-like enzyme